MSSAMKLRFYVRFSNFLMLEIRVLLLLDFVIVEGGALSATTRYSFNKLIRLYPKLTFMVLISRFRLERAML